MTTYKNAIYAQHGVISLSNKGVFVQNVMLEIVALKITAQCGDF